MRIVASVLVCAALVLALAGCDPTTERRYFTEGGGVDLYAADRAPQIELQKEYISFVCQQTGMNTCPGNWTLFVQAGMNDIDQRCDGFLTWLDARRRDKEPVLAEINALSTATHAIMTVTGASPKSLDIVVAAFGLASATYTNWNSRLLISVNQSTVQTVVYAAQTEFRTKINGYTVPDQPAAIYLLRSYLRTCMPTTIEAEINSTPVLVQRADQSDVKGNPLINPVKPAAIRGVPANPRHGTITQGNLGTDDARKILTQYVYPNGVLQGRDELREKDVADFMKDNHIRTLLSNFIDSDSFAAQRVALVNKLKAAGKIK